MCDAFSRFFTLGAQFVYLRCYTLNVMLQFSERFFFNSQGMTQVMNMSVFLNQKSYYDLMLILNGIMVALVRLIFIHIFMIFIGLANFGSPFKAGSGPNVQLMKLTTTRTLKHSRSTMYCND